MEQAKFIAPLHGLRGIAVLFVLVSHFGNSGLNFIPYINLGGSGKVGVWLFFVLSAYLLTSQLVATFRAKPWAGALYSYFVRRVFRIYPLFILALAIHLIRDISFAELLRHLVLQAGHDELWAIPVEFKYYFAIPVIAAIAALGGSGVALVATAAALAFCGWYSIGHSALVFSNELDLIPKAAPFLLGSALALWRDVRKDGWLSSSAVVLAVPAFLALAYAFKLAAKGQLALAWHPWLSIGMGIVVAIMVSSSLQPGWFSRFAGNRVLVYFGEISFSLYLLHMFVVRVAGKLPDLPMMGWPTLFVCVAVAHVSYRMVEVPGMRLGKYLSDIRGKKPAPVAG